MKAIPSFSCNCTRLGNKALHFWTADRPPARRFAFRPPFTQHVAEHVIEAWFASLSQQLIGIEIWPRLYPVDKSYTVEVGRESRKISFKEHVVFYQVDDERREIHVVAFLHGATRKEV